MSIMKNLQKRYVTIVVALLSLLFCSVASASAFPVITTDDLKGMIASKKEFVLIDARTRPEYQEAHIDGAINIPEKEFDRLAPTMLPDKAKQVVLYCSGIKCGKSKRTAVKAAALGYTNLVLYNEGFPVWEERGYKIVAGPEYEKKINTTKVPPAELKQWIDGRRQDYVLVDVRDAAEFQEGHIPTAISIPAEQLAVRSEVLPKEKKVVVYCNSGSRSYMAYRKLMRMEYKNIYQSIFADWKEAGYPVEK